MSIYAKNNKLTSDSWLGNIRQPGVYFEITESERLPYSQNDKVFSDIGSGDLIIAKDETGNTDFYGIEGYNFLNPIEGPQPHTDDNRKIIAINRIQPGYTMYPTGSGSDFSTPSYNDGDDLVMDADNKTKVFRFMRHWYAIGGRAIWEGADLDDSLAAKLYAPASTGMINQTGDFTKVEIIPSSGMHIIVPLAQGAGDWDIDLTEKIGSSDALKCTPVPNASGNGMFDYDTYNNVLTVNTTQEGKWDLYDFDIDLFKFINKIWGRKSDGAESNLESSDVVGKLLLNTWAIKFELTTTKTSGIKVGVVITTAVDKNV